MCRIHGESLSAPRKGEFHCEFLERCDPEQLQGHLRPLLRVAITTFFQSLKLSLHRMDYARYGE
ncbi:MAG: hypothetical protein EBX97_06545 [Actinobacteria bacterium]|nr:hypothetical protein [Actinomycetota bacterium]